MNYQFGYKCDNCHRFYREHEVSYHEEYEAIPYGEQTIMLQEHVVTPCCKGECEVVIQQV